MHMKEEELEKRNNSEEHNILGCDAVQSYRSLPKHCLHLQHRKASIVLKTEAVHSSEASVNIYNIMRYHISPPPALLSPCFPCVCVCVSRLTPLSGTGTVNTFSPQEQNCWTRCFLCGPCCIKYSIYDETKEAISSSQNFLLWVILLH
jgi:hypothetical protein